jgi:putative DNA primase/helicase
MGTAAEHSARVLEQARGRWRSILVALGVDAAHLSGKHIPCPMCGGKDRFRFDDKGGRGRYYCNGCGPGDGMDLLMKCRGWDFNTAVAEVGGVVGALLPKPSGSNKGDPRRGLRWIDKGCRPLTGSDPASVYLKFRGLSTLPAALRWHPGLPYYGEGGRKLEEYAAMLGPVRARDGQPVTWHVTYLFGGEKAPVKAPRKIMPGLAPIAGGAVRLFPEASHLGVAEGIETAIAAYELCGLPVWAALSTSGLKAFEPPPGLKAMTIFADHDANNAGQAAAYQLAQRLAAMGLTVYVEIPPTVGADFLDVLNGRGAAKCTSMVRRTQMRVLGRPEGHGD